MNLDPCRLKLSEFRIELMMRDLNPSCTYSSDSIAVMSETESLEETAAGKLTLLLSFCIYDSIISICNSRMYFVMTMCVANFLIIFLSYGESYCAGSKSLSSLDSKDTIFWMVLRLNGALLSQRSITPKAF